MKIDFYHNVVCSFCFMQSARLRELFKAYPQIQVRHKSFPLRYTLDKSAIPFKQYDSSGDITRHWEIANKMDKDHRFNIQGMRQVDFDFPTSRLSEMAIKAAVLTEGESIHWDMFDHFQEALFVRNLNLSDEAIIHELIQETEVDYEKWLDFYQDPATEAAIFADFEEAEEIGLDLIPSLVHEGKIIIRGAIRPELVEKEIEKLWDSPNAY